MIAMSITGSIVISCIILVRSLVYHHVPKKIIQLLWGIAFFSLILPLSFPLGPKLLLNQKLPVATVPIYQLYSDVTAYNTQAATPNLVSSNQVERLLPLCYAIVVSSLLLYLFFSYNRSMRPIREALPIEHPFIKQWQEKQQLVIKRKLTVCYSDQISSPLTAGIFSPKIVLPADFDWDNQASLEFVLTHEMTHIKQFDVLKKLLMLIVTVLHFFNPLVWVMSILVNRDIETYCDEQTVNELGLHRKRDYALCLVSYIEQKQQTLMFQQAFAKNAIEERIESIMKLSTKKNKILSISIISLVAVIFMGVTAIHSQATFDNSQTQTSFSYVNQKQPSTPKTTVEQPMTAAQLKAEIVTFKQQKNDLLSSGSLTKKAYEQSLADMEQLLVEVENGTTLIDDGNKAYAEATHHYQDEHVAEMDGRHFEAATEEELEAKILRHQNNKGRHRSRNSNNQHCRTLTDSQ